MLNRCLIVIFLISCGGRNEPFQSVLEGSWQLHAEGDSCVTLKTATSLHLKHHRSIERGGRSFNYRDEVQLFSDDQCQNSWAQISYTGVYRPLGMQPSFTPEALMIADQRSNYSMVMITDQSVEWANYQKICGIENWEKNKKILVSDEPCRIFNSRGDEFLNLLQVDLTDRVMTFGQEKASSIPSALDGDVWIKNS